METCDVLIVGGGPSGSACAWKLIQSGIDVIVVDKSQFPRDKVCAGWLTLPVFEELGIDAADYRNHGVLQEITRFVTGIIGGPEVETEYHRVVSYGIRRCEFDNYLLRRTNARLLLGMPFQSLRHDGDYWIFNDAVRAPIVVGAGGHFCPVARLFSEPASQPSWFTKSHQPTVLAQEIEVELTSDQQKKCTIAPDRPELFFCSDLKGYGWVFRKENFINIGLGHECENHLSARVQAFVGSLIAQGKIPEDMHRGFCGHAYRLRTSPPHRSAVEGVLLVGDAAGLANPESGEGIRPAIESGLLAATSILEAGKNARSQLGKRFERKLRGRFDGSSSSPLIRLVPTSLRLAGARYLMKSSWFAHRVLLDRWFLKLNQRPLV